MCVSKTSKILTCYWNCCWNHFFWPDLSRLFFYHFTLLCVFICSFFCLMSWMYSFTGTMSTKMWNKSNITKKMSTLTTNMTHCSQNLTNNNNYQLQSNLFSSMFFFICFALTKHLEVFSIDILSLQLFHRIDPFMLCVYVEMHQWIAYCRPYCNRFHADILFFAITHLFLFKEQQKKSMNKDNTNNEKHNLKIEKAQLWARINVIVVIVRFVFWNGIFS